MKLLSKEIPLYSSISRIEAQFSHRFEAEKLNRLKSAQKCVADAGNLSPILAKAGEYNLPVGAVRLILPLLKLP